MAHFTKCICVPLSIEASSRLRSGAPGFVVAVLTAAQRPASGDAKFEAAVLPVGDGSFRAARHLERLGGGAERRSPGRGVLAATG